MCSTTRGSFRYRQGRERRRRLRRGSWGEAECHYAKEMVSSVIRGSRWPEVVAFQTSCGIVSAPKSDGCSAILKEISHVYRPAGYPSFTVMDSLPLTENRLRWHLDLLLREMERNSSRLSYLEMEKVGAARNAQIGRFDAVGFEYGCFFTLYLVIISERNLQKLCL